MKRGFKMLGIILLCIIAVIIIAAGIYFYKCTHYWQKDYKDTMKAGFTEKQIALDDGSVIHYAEGPDNGEPLLLIHGQTGAWEDYCTVLPELSKNWHVFAVDCYGHGGSTHDESKYYLNVLGNDLIWFINEVIGQRTVVSGHSSGALIASYITAYGGELVRAAVLEDPPVFSTEQDYFEKSFAYWDTYKNMHDYVNSDRSECWEAYYLRHCLWGQLYMSSSVDGLANYAQKYSKKYPDKPVQLFFMPGSVNFMFLNMKEYDFAFGEHFYDYSWHAGISHAQLMSDINVPTIYIHALDQYSEDGILMAAASNDQARKAVELIGECEMIELSSNHDIHRFHPEVFIDAVNRFLEK